jgi:hypothetical protein
MSFFGALQGLGLGMADEGAYLEKVALSRDLQQERQAGELQRQRERAQDRADRERENILLRAELGGGGRGKGGGGGGLNLFEMAQSADTPEKQERLMESTRAFAGDDAANVLGRIFGRSSGAETVNPTPGDFARFDRTLDESGQSAEAPPASYVQRAQVDAEKGRLGLQRLMAMVAGPDKLKGYAEGEGQLMVNDAVKGAMTSGSDPQMRQAGAAALAIGGKDRFGVSDGTGYDKSGVAPSTTTEVGKSKIAENNAQAGKASAEAKNGGKELKSKEFQGLQQERLALDKDLDRLSDEIRDLRKNRGAGWNEEVQRLTAKRSQVEGQKESIQQRIRDFTVNEGERARGGAKDKPEAKPQPAASPRQITSESQFRALKSGTRFVAPDGSIRIKP